MKRVLVTGGAGFIGSFMCEELLRHGARVTVLDRLEQQVHRGKRPDYMPSGVRFIRGDVGNPAVARRALKDVDRIVHLAAAVGVGQSMYEIQKYVDLNTYQTASFLELLSKQPKKIKKLVVASSMSIYGEGAYRCKHNRLTTIEARPMSQLRKHQWEARDPEHPSEVLQPIPTPESLSLRPTSIYAITKRDQEEMCLTIGKSYGIPTVALRFFNVYGPRQALSNPYTGVAAIFSSRLLNGNVPLVYEDGLQTRDFTHVTDITQACYLALTRSAGDYRAMNVGTGRPLAVREVARILASQLGVKTPYRLAGQFRVGDIRHCYGDIRLIQSTLGYRPKVRFEEGITDLVEWVRRQSAHDLTQRAASELSRKGLIW